MPNKTASLDIAIIIQPTDPGVVNRDEYVDCDTVPGLVKDFLEAVSAAERAATEQLNLTIGRMKDLNEAVSDLKSDVDYILSQNPDDDGVKSTNDLATTLNMAREDDSDTVQAQRLAERFDIVTTGGKVLLSGDSDIRALGSLYQLVQPTIPNLQLLIEQASGKFIFVTTYIKTTETEVAQSCGSVTELAFNEQFIATNKSIADSAKIAGISEDEVITRVFWVGEAPVRNATNIQRLQAFGLSSDAIQSALLLQGNTQLIQEDTLDRLQEEALLDDEEIAELLTNTNDNTPKINTEPDFDDIQNAIVQAAQAGRRAASDGTPGNESGIGLVLSRINVGKALDVESFAENVDPDAFDEEDELDPEDGGIIRSDDSVPQLDQGSNPDQEAAEACRALFNALNGASKSLQRFITRQETLGAQLKPLEANLGLARSGLNLDACIARFNVGSTGVINRLTGDLPGLNFGINMQQKIVNVRDRFSVVLNANVDLATRSAELGCLAQQLALAVLGGACGLDPPDIGLCPTSLDDLAEAVQRVVFVNNVLISATIGAVASLALTLDPIDSRVVTISDQITCQEEVNKLAKPLFDKLNAVL